MPRIIKRTRKHLVPRTCFYCQQKINPDFKDLQNLSSFLTPRGKILARRRSGICTKHQRKLAKAVKRSRIMAMV